MIGSSLMATSKFVLRLTPWKISPKAPLPSLRVKRKVLPTLKSIEKKMKVGKGKRREEVKRRRVGRLEKGEKGEKGREG